MAEIVRTGQWLPGGRTAVELLGADHGAEVTLIIEDMKPGGGPRSTSIRIRRFGW